MGGGGLNLLLRKTKQTRCTGRETEKQTERKRSDVVGHKTMEDGGRNLREIGNKRRGEKKTQLEHA